MTVAAWSGAELRVLVVDDEDLARQRMATLLGDCVHPRARLVGEASNARVALELMAQMHVDLVLLDVHMPGADGLALAQALRAMPDAPRVVFVTAHTEHAVQAFELEAVDYLTKPVRLERLQSALQKVERLAHMKQGLAGSSDMDEVLVIQERHRTERVPLAQVVYFKAELKYITVRTAQRSYILDGALNDLEEKYAPHFLRIHRNALVTRRAIRALEKSFDPDEGADGWAVRLHRVEELLAVSRRQLATVRAVLSG